MGLLEAVDDGCQIGLQEAPVWVPEGRSWCCAGVRDGRAASRDDPNVPPSSAYGLAVTAIAATGHGSVVA
jgi:hypothetical protein